MDELTWLLFESRIALGIALFLVNFFLLVHWRRGGRARPLLIAVAVSAALLLTQALVVTKREAADRLLATVERGLLASDAAPLAQALAPGFVAGDMDRAAFLARVERELRRWRVHSLGHAPLRIERPAARNPPAEQPETRRSETARSAPDQSDALQSAAENPAAERPTPRRSAADESPAAQRSGVDTFTILVQYSADVTFGDYRGLFPTSWRIRFSREPAGWRIENIEPVSIGRQTVQSWRQVGS
jgi:hypothetical protein